MVGEVEQQPGLSQGKDRIHRGKGIQARLAWREKATKTNLKLMCMVCVRGVRMEEVRKSADLYMRRI